MIYDQSVYVNQSSLLGRKGVLLSDVFKQHSGAGGASVADVAGLRARITLLLKDRVVPPTSCLVKFIFRRGVELVGHGFSACLPTLVYVSLCRA